MSIVAPPPYSFFVTLSFVRLKPNWTVKCRTLPTVPSSSSFRSWQYAGKKRDQYPFLSAQITTRLQFTTGKLIYLITIWIHYHKTHKILQLWSRQNKKHFRILKSVTCSDKMWNLVDYSLPRRTEGWSSLQRRSPAVPLLPTSPSASRREHAFRPSASLWKVGRGSGGWFRCKLFLWWH